MPPKTKNIVSLIKKTTRSPAAKRSRSSPSVSAPSSSSVSSAKNESSKGGVEHHPLAPFLPADARILLLGTFPPPFIRWSVPFFYPNINNDMWKMMGLLFYEDADKFITQRKASEIEEDMKTWLARREMVQLQNGTAPSMSQENPDVIQSNQIDATGVCDGCTVEEVENEYGKDQQPLKRNRVSSEKLSSPKKRDVLKKTPLKADIEAFLIEKQIAIFDVATSIRRLAGNAADDLLEIVEPTDILDLLQRIPECSVIASTGGLAHEYAIAAMMKHGTRVMAKNTAGSSGNRSTKITSKIGDVERFLLPGGRVINIVRCPSTSRANPMKLSVKADTYAKALKLAQIL